MDYFKRLIEAVEQSDKDVLFDALADAKIYYDVLSRVHKPLGGLVIIKEIEPDDKVNGIYVSLDDNQHYGILIAKGDEVDKVVVDKIYFWVGNFGERFTFEGEDFFIGHWTHLKAEV